MYNTVNCKGGAPIQDSGDQKLLQLIGHISRVHGIDFTHYRRATVKRKLDLRLSETGCADYGSYLAYLSCHPEEYPQLLSALSVTHSTFFRTPVVFELLHAAVLPRLVEEQGEIRALSMGCARGEEPYSIAILLREMLTREKARFVHEIVGVDFNPEALNCASRGIYSAAELGEVKKRYLDEWFEPLPQGHGTEQSYRMKDTVLKMVRFVLADLAQIRTHLSPRSAFNLVLCRNVLIYADREMLDEIMDSIDTLLKPGGCLVMGETECLPEKHGKNYSRIFPGIHIFRKES